MGTADFQNIASGRTLDVLLAACTGAWRRGVNDCFVAAADQLAAWFGVDPMARYRGRYRSQTGYLRIIRQDDYETPRDAFCGEMKKAGFHRVEDDPQDCDAALAAFLEAGRPTIAPALFFEGFWHIRSKDGWLALDGETGILEVFRWASK